MKFLFLLFCLFILGCSSLLDKGYIGGRASIQIEEYKEAIDCTGKGLFIKSIKKIDENARQIEGSNFFLEKGTYYIYYSYKEQFLSGAKSEGEIQADPCAVKTIIYSSLNNQEINIENYPKIKIKIDPNKKYYLYIKDRKVYVEST